MEILAFSGLHGNRDLIDVFIKSITVKNLHPDVLVCAGDVGDSIIFELFTKLSQFKIPILFVSGDYTLHDNNPDEVEKAEKNPYVFRISDQNFSLKDSIFIGQDAWSNFTDNKRIGSIKNEIH